MANLMPLVATSSYPKFKFVISFFEDYHRILVILNSRNCHAIPHYVARILCVCARRNAEK